MAADALYKVDMESRGTGFINGRKCRVTLYRYNWISEIPAAQISEGCGFIICVIRLSDGHRACSSGPKRIVS